MIAVVSKDALRFTEAVKAFRDKFPSIPEHIAIDVVAELIEKGDEAIEARALDLLNEYHGESLRLSYCL